MSPKKAAVERGRGRGRGGAAAGRGGAAAADDVAELPATDANSGLLSRIDETVTSILSHKDFRNITNAMPLTANQGASGAPYDKEACKRAMGSGGVYHCHINLFWIDPQFIAMAGVPIREEAVNQAVDELFQFGGMTSRRHWRWECRIRTRSTRQLTKAPFDGCRRRRIASPSCCAWTGT